MSPYHDALAWIRRHPGTGSSDTLAKLILSVWNVGCGFSIRECLHNLDADRTALALRMVAHLAAHGEDTELVTVGYEICHEYPQLWDLGQAGERAKHALRDIWDKDAAAARG
jgi:hypothetical protein